MLKKLFGVVAALFLLAGPAMAVPAAQVAAVSTSPAPYLGVVDTRNYPGRNALTGAGRWQMTTATTYARDTIVNPAIIAWNWTQGNQVETAGVAGQIKIAIEYPAGTCTLSDENTAAGNALVTWPVGNPLYHFTGLTIPNGAKYWKRVLLVGASTPFFQFQSNDLPLPEDGWESGTGTVSDKTNCSAQVAPNVISYYPPTVAMTRNPAVMQLGDSRAEGGTQGGLGYATGDAGETMPVVGQQYGYISFAESGTWLNEYMTASRTYREQFLPYVTAVEDAMGVNDIGANGATAAGLAGLRANFAALYPTKTIIGTTLLPYITSTDGFATLANQNLATGSNIIINSFNALVRTGIPGENYVWDLAGALDPYRRGAYPVSRNLSDTAQATAVSVTGSIAAFSATPTGTLTNGSSAITSVSSTSGLLTGQRVTSTPYGMPFGTTITSISGSTVNISSPYRGVTTTAAQLAITGGTLTVTAVASGALAVNMPLWSSGIASGTYITTLNSGTGGTGTYQVSRSQTLSSATITNGAFCSIDGLHVGAVCYQMLWNSGAIDLNALKRTPKPGAANDNMPSWEVASVGAA